MEIKDKLEKYKQDHDFPFIFLPDPNMEYFNKYNILQFPTIVVVKGGKILYIEESWKKGSEEKILKILKNEKQ